jgi:hypothetical protein
MMHAESVTVAASHALLDDAGKAIVVGNPVTGLCGQRSRT